MIAGSGYSGDVSVVSAPAPSSLAPQYFVRDTLFKVEGDLHMVVQDLVPGSRVISTSGAAMKVVRKTAYAEARLVRLTAGSATLAVPPNHRILVPPAPDGSGISREVFVEWRCFRTNEVLAGDLNEGDLVVCTNGIHSLTQARIVENENGTEVYAIHFQLDEPVAAFTPFTPTETIVSMGAPVSRTRRAGMWRRGRRARNSYAASMP